jgi:hypothetical protein
MREPGEPPVPDVLPGKTPEELPDPGPIKPTTPNPAVDHRTAVLVIGTIKIWEF